MISDTPGRGGEGGSKKGKFLRTSFMDGPLDIQTSGHGSFRTTEVKILAIFSGQARTISQI